MLLWHGIAKAYGFLSNWFLFYFLSKICNSITNLKAANGLLQLVKDLDYFPNCLRFIDRTRLLKTIANIES